MALPGQENRYVPGGTGSVGGSAGAAVAMRGRGIGPFRGRPQRRPDPAERPLKDTTRFYPYADLPDFADRSVSVPDALGRMQNAANQDILERYGLPDHARVAAMQQTLNQIRHAGGINFSTPGQRSSLAARAEGPDPAQLALLLRRRAQMGA